MLNTRLIAGSLLAVLMALVFSAEVLAQFPGGGRSSAGKRGESGRGTIQAPRQANSGDVAELIEFRLGMLEEDLRLSPPQLKSWDPYAAQVRAIAADIVRERAPAQAIGVPTALQQINRAVDNTRNRLAALEDVAAAAKAFYELLSPEQRMLVDSRMPSILPLISGGAAPGGAPEGGGRGRSSRDDGAGFTPPERRLP